MKKILTFVIVAVVLVGLFSVAAVSVYAKGGNKFCSSIIQKIAERFNLNAEEVQKVFDEARDEIRQEMPDFNQLTDEQKEALSTKREELKEKLEELKDLSLEEKQAKTEELRGELEAWAEKNGIDVKFMNGIFGGPQNGFGPGPRQGHPGQEQQEQ